MNVKKININQQESSYYIASDIYDVTSNNNGATFESLTALLSDENLSTLIPTEVRCGGMNIRFVQTSDNKYAQYRLMTNDFSTTVSNWQDAAIIGTDRIANKAVTTEKIADNAITTTTITNHAVTTDKLDGTISASILYTNALNDSIKNSWVLEQTTTNNMAAIFKQLFEMSGSTQMKMGEIGTLVDASNVLRGKFYTTKFIKVKPNTTYTIASTTIVQEFDENFVFIAAQELAPAWAVCTFTTKDNTFYIKALTVYAGAGSTYDFPQIVKYINEGETINRDYPPQEEMDGCIIGEKLIDGSVDESKLSTSVQQKLNKTLISDLSHYTMYSIGDSMSAANKWQARVVELTNIQWSSDRNTMGGSPLSVGGTTSSSGFYSGLMRTWNLIKNGYIQGDGENTVVVFQNVNDGKQIFTPVSNVFTPTNIIEGYNESDWGNDMLNDIEPKYGTIIKLLRNRVKGKNLSITNLPINDGNVTLKVGWGGPGIKNYGITVTASETIQTLIDKILEWNYDGVTDSLAADGNSVDFSRGATDDTYPITVEFIDTDNTGMTVSIIDTDNASVGVTKYFVGESLDTWNDTNSWKSSLTWSEAFMSSIEMIQRTYPKAIICVAIFPRHHATPSNYKRHDGTFDTNTWLTTDTWEQENADRVSELEKLCKFYNINCINVDKYCNISLNNYSTFYQDNNIHPKDTGYLRIGEVVVNNLKNILI